MKKFLEIGEYRLTTPPLDGESSLTAYTTYAITNGQSSGIAQHSMKIVRKVGMLKMCQTREKVSHRLSNGVDSGAYRIPAILGAVSFLSRDL